MSEIERILKARGAFIAEIRKAISKDYHLLVKLKNESESKIGSVFQQYQNDYKTVLAQNKKIQNFNTELHHMKQNHIPSQPDKVKSILEQLNQSLRNKELKLKMSTYELKQKQKLYIKQFLTKIIIQLHSNQRVMDLKKTVDETYPTLHKYIHSWKQEEIFHLEYLLHSNQSIQITCKEIIALIDSIENQSLDDHHMIKKVKEEVPVKCKELSTLISLLFSDQKSKIALNSLAKTSEFIQNQFIPKLSDDSFKSLKQTILIVSSYEKTKDKAQQILNLSLGGHDTALNKLNNLIYKRQDLIQNCYDSKQIIYNTAIKVLQEREPILFFRH